MTILILSVLLIIVVSNMFARYLSIISGGSIETTAVFKMISIRLPKYIAYLLPIAFFSAILIVYGGLFANNELTIAFACGISWARLLKFIMVPALGLCILELFLTLIILPKMDQQYSLVQKATTKNSLLSFIQPGKIIPFNGGNQVVYAKSVGLDSIFRDIFIYQQKPIGGSKIIAAPSGIAKTTVSGNQYLIVRNGHFYNTDKGVSEIQKGYFIEVTEFIPTKIYRVLSNSVESISTYRLITSSQLSYQAEFQWRLSFPLIIIVSSMIALVMSKMPPRRSRYSKIFPAMIVFIIYFNLLSLSRSWLSNEYIPIWLGLWWVHIFFAGTMLVTIKKYNGTISNSNRKKQVKV